MPDYDAIIKAVENDKPLPKNVIDIPDVKESHTSYINCMQELNERIAQLTELVNTGTKTLESLEETLKTVEKERDRLADQRAGIEPKFERVKDHEYYYSVSSHTLYKGLMAAWEHYELHSQDDNECFENNNYFRTEERAQEVANKINLLLKLERLHDTYCPDYKPNWNNNNENKYFVYYHNRSRYYGVDIVFEREHETEVFFPTFEIAQKVCDILNKELEEKK